MTFRINVDSHQKRQRFIVTISIVRMQYFLILAYYVRLAVINAAGLERNGCFSLPLLREECCVVIEKNIDKKLTIRISYRI